MLELVLVSLHSLSMFDTSAGDVKQICQDIVKTDNKDFQAVLKFAKIELHHTFAQGISELGFDLEINGQDPPFWWDDVLQETSNSTFDLVKFIDKKNPFNSPLWKVIEWLRADSLNI